MRRGKSDQWDGFRVRGVRPARNRSMRAGVCRLCLAQERLAHSHILPEFLYTDLYDETRRFIAVSSDAPQRNKFKQKGLREYLLCQGCEGKFSVWETYAKKVLKGSIDLSCVRDDSG